MENLKLGKLEPEMEDKKIREIEKDNKLKREVILPMLEAMKGMSKTISRMSTILLIEAATLAIWTITNCMVLWKIYH